MNRLGTKLEPSRNRIKTTYRYKVEIDNLIKVETKPGAIKWKVEKRASYIILSASKDFHLCTCCEERYDILLSRLYFLLRWLQYHDRKKERSYNSKSTFSPQLYPRITMHIPLTWHVVIGLEIQPLFQKSRGTYEITKLVKFSPKRDSHLRKIDEKGYYQNEDKYFSKFSTLRLFSVTCWAARASSLTSLWKLWKARGTVRLVFRWIQR